MAQRPVRTLLVEGDEDKRVIPELIEQATGVPWEEPRGSRLVNIKPAGGIEKLLEPDYIGAELKTAQLHSLGVLLDADTDPMAQWQALRKRCLPVHPDFPVAPPPEGVVLVLERGVRFGAWLMPDNLQRGMLETFLLLLRPDGHSPDLWAHTRQAVRHSRTIGAVWREAHEDKALIHTFLAWQDPPGRQLHQALKERLLDARSPASAPFVAWFRRLFEI
jgi:hypothetical protein